MSKHLATARRKNRKKPPGEPVLEAICLDRLGASKSSPNQFEMNSAEYIYIYIYKHDRTCYIKIVSKYVRGSNEKDWQPLV